jgi:hypothetical protein
MNQFYGLDGDGIQSKENLAVLHLRRGLIEKHFK